MQNDEHRVAEWAPLRTASAAYGVTKEALRRRIHRGELEHRTDNRGRLLVPLPAGVADKIATNMPPKRRKRGADETPTVAALRRELAAAREELAAAGAREVELRREMGEAKVERDRLLRLFETERARLDRLLGEHHERRPWPGLKAWWRRVWEGEG